MWIVTDRDDVRCEGVQVVPGVPTEVPDWFGSRLVRVGWAARVERPAAPEPVEIRAVQQLGVDDNLNGTETVAEIRAAYFAGRVTLDEIEAAEQTRATPRAGIVRFIEAERAKQSTPSDEGMENG